MVVTCIQTVSTWLAVMHVSVAMVTMEMGHIAVSLVCY